ncbi:minor capsid protein [Ruegeria phage RpAliso]|nr:minor capsid protein [Ruegeria phage RpAliso]
MSEVNHLFDAAMAFRSPASAAITASETVGELPLDKLVNVRPSSQSGKLGAQCYKLILKIEDAAFVTEYVAPDPELEIEEELPEAYTVTLESGAAGATDTALITFEVTGPGIYTFPLDASTIEKVDASHEAVALKLAIEGDAPSIKLAAWVL